MRTDVIAAGVRGAGGRLLYGLAGGAGAITRPPALQYLTHHQLTSGIYLVLYSFHTELTTKLTK